MKRLREEGETEEEGEKRDTSVRRTGSGGGRPDEAVTHPLREGPRGGVMIDWAVVDSDAEDEGGGTQGDGAPGIVSRAEMRAPEEVGEGGQPVESAAARGALEGPPEMAVETRQPMWLYAAPLRRDLPLQKYLSSLTCLNVLRYNTVVRERGQAVAKRAWLRRLRGWGGYVRNMDGLPEYKANMFYVQDRGEMPYLHRVRKMIDDFRHGQFEEPHSKLDYCMLARPFDALPCFSREAKWREMVRQEQRTRVDPKHQMFVGWHNEVFFELV